MILPVVILSAVVLLAAYLSYGRLLEKWFGVDPSRPTPAVTREDGNDFVPAPSAIVLGGHFTAIAAAGPIVGPIVAGMAFGWLPALLWILFGAIFIGGVHDMGSLIASVRHKASSITQIVREHMSPRAYATFLAFVWIALVYIIIAFADVTARTFANYQREVAVVSGVTHQFAINGGAVAIGAMAYLVLSIVLGLLLRFTRVDWRFALAACVAMLGASIWFSPMLAQWLSAAGLSFFDTSRFTSPGSVTALTHTWQQAILAYCFVASVTPMWLLLQPRGAIGASFLYLALGFGLIGSIVGAFIPGATSIKWPAFVAFQATDLGLLFPFLFITVACGACSGFHSIVASGTTCKQVRSERDIKPVAYGAMLLEALVAVLALACVMMLPEGSKGSPDVIYARGLGKFMSFLGIPVELAVGFGLLAFSSFVFDTLDVATRLGRYVMQEMLGLSGLLGGAAATLITLLCPATYLWFSPSNAFKTFWSIFGTSNQLLAALALVAVTVWLARTGRKIMFVLIPAVFMVVTTLVALAMNLQTFARKWRTGHQGNDLVNAALAGLLIALAILVLVEAVRSLRQARASRVA